MYPFRVGMFCSGCEKTTGLPLTSAHLIFASIFLANSKATFLSENRFLLRLLLWMMETHQPDFPVRCVTLTPNSSSLD
jgi:hypothetical protein